jgi:hypothetical protein
MPRITTTSPRWRTDTKEVVWAVKHGLVRVDGAAMVSLNHMSGADDPDGQYSASDYHGQQNFMPSRSSTPTFTESRDGHRGREPYVRPLIFLIVYPLTTSPPGLKKPTSLCPRRRSRMSSLISPTNSVSKKVRSPQHPLADFRLVTKRLRFPHDPARLASFANVAQPGSPHPPRRLHWW